MASKGMMKSFAIAVLLLMALPLAGRAAPPPDDLAERLNRLRPIQLDEVVWLARCIYSESNKAHEQRLVAWVVRNRMETGFRGNTYREVVLEPKQFSAFNRPTPRRTYILGLNQHSSAKSWRTALGIALDVYQAPSRKRPFSITTRHFYSPVSMKNGATPRWADESRRVDVSRFDIDENRFRFYEGIDDALDPPPMVEDTPVRAATDTTPSTIQKSRSRLRDRRRTFSGRVPRPARPKLNRPRRKDG